MRRAAGWGGTVHLRPLHQRVQRNEVLQQRCGPSLWVPSQGEWGRGQPRAMISAAETEKQKDFPLKLLQLEISLGKKMIVPTCVI